MGADGYPRTCRRGHLIEGPHQEHRGAHRQCYRCRRRTQRAADARYWQTHKQLSIYIMPGLRLYLATVQKEDAGEDF